MDQDETWRACRPRPWPLCVRWGPSSASPKGAQPSPNFGPYLLRPNGCIDQIATWYGGRPRPRRLCVRWGPHSPSQERGRSLTPKLSAHVYYSQTAGWIKMVLGMEVGLSPDDIVMLDGDPAPSPKRGQSHLPNFQPISIVAKRSDAPRCHLVWS